MIVFPEDCGRDLERKEAAASMAGPAVAGKKKEAAAAGGGKKKEAAASTAAAGGGKKKGAAASMAGSGKEEAGASEPRVPLAVLFSLESTSEAQLAAAGKKKKEATLEKTRKLAVASDSDDGALNKEHDSFLKEGEMLKLREELWEAEKLWMDGLVEGALDRYLEKKLTEAPSKKRKVVRVAVPDAYIHFIMENSTLMSELSDEEMAQCPEGHRQLYAIQKLVNAKELAYQKAIIDQYNTFGFAYDEKVVTDDDEKEVALVATN